MFVFSDRANARTARETKFSWLSKSKQNISLTQDKENNMKYLFSILLIFNSICTLVILVSGMSRKDRRQAEDYLFGIVSIASMIWSFGFGMFFIQTETEPAHFWRSFAVFGTFLYMVSVQGIICRISEIRKPVRHLLNIISNCGWPIYALSIVPSHTDYFMSEFGMTYKFAPGIVNKLYTWYFILVSANIVAVIIHMICFSKLRRVRVFGKYFLIITALIWLGTVLDMIFPALGLPALPGSNVTQFWGIIILYYAMIRIKRNELNVSNMSEYIYRSLAVPVVVFDKEHRLHISNEAANVYLGINTDPNEYNSQKVTDFFDVDFDNGVIDGNNSISVECTKKSDNAPCNLSISTINDKYGDVIGYIAMIKDMSERVKYINELKEARENADISNQAKSTFLANMSHEIRTPMNAIVGFSEIILKQDMDRQELMDYVTDIRDSSYGLLAIINDILDISKIESGKMELVPGEYNFKEMLQNVIVQILPLADKKSLRFDIECDPQIPCRVYGDDTRIQEILINVLNNAVKYTDTGYIKLIVGRDISDDDSQINIVFKAADSGRGIKEEDKSLIFDAFEQVNKKLHQGIEGTGLGLSIVKGYVNLMQGSIDVDSKFGEGSVFTIKIPQKLVDDEPIGELDFNTHSYLKSNIGDLYISDTSVLVVDDNDVNLKVIRKSLECYGLDVTTVDSGAKAVELCRKQKFDIVIMDQMMPEMDGIQAMKEIRKLSDHYASGGKAKIIALTANAVKGAREELMEEGFDEYVKKPIEFEHLEKILCTFISEHKISRLDNSNTGVSNTGDLSQEQIRIYGDKINAIKGIEGMDVKAGLVHCGGQVNDYIDILSLVVETGRKYLNTMREKISRDIKEYVIEIHAVKGMCYNIGAEDCGDAAKELEMAGRNNDMAYIMANQSSFEDRFSGLLNDIEKAIADKKQVGETGAAKWDMSLAQYVEKIKSATAEYDIPTAEKILNSIKDMPLSDEEAQAVQELEKLIDDVDFDAIEQFEL